MNRARHCLFASSLLLAVCSSSACSTGAGNPPATFAPSTVNLGLVTQSSELASDGDLLLVAAREFQAGGSDLNADGDAFDLIVFLIDLATGTSINTGLALDASTPEMVASVRGDLALFAVSEASSAGRDLNGDGDITDSVVHVFDRRTGTTRSLGLALSLAVGSMPALGGNLAAFAVSEAQQSADLDGDGLLASDVLHVYDSSTLAIVNTGLDTSSRLFVDGGGVAWFADELAGDRNGDGDDLDRFVLQVFDLRSETSIDTHLATDGAAPQFAGGSWMFAVDELAQGADLDGDGAALDFIAHTFEPATGLQRNLRLACLDEPCALPIRTPGVREQFAFRVSRTKAPGDAPDMLDAVLFLFAPAANVLIRTGFAALTRPVVAGVTLGFLVLESEQGVDLDGDDELTHAVAVATDLAKGASASLGQEAIDIRGAGEVLILARRESAAGEDWNVDGDLDDVVEHVYFPLTDETINTRIASVDSFGASADEVLIYVDERAEGRDLNSDGDQDDLVFVLFDLERELAASLQLSGSLGAGRFGSLSPDGGLAVLADELTQGRDLNGDGDLADLVLYRGE